MRYEIYHVKKPTFGFGNKPVYPDFYDKVAVVNCVDPDDAFRVTNHIDQNWTKNPEVVELFKEKVRSTSVGDVVVAENGNKFYCDSIGWTDVLEKQ